MESFGYATEMNPKLKGKKTPLLPPEPTEEYIPPAFNASEVPLLKSQSTAVPAHACIHNVDVFPVEGIQKYPQLVATTVLHLAFRPAAEPAGQMYATR